MAAKRILVVDDEPNVVKSCARMLELEGYEAQGVTSGAEAVSLYQDDDFDLALVDLKMPEMDGLEVLATIREYDPKAVVVIFTAHGTKESAVEALRLGASEFLEKPLRTKTLIATVERVLARSDGRAVRGNLRTMGLPSIVQVNCAEGNQARLRLRHRGQEGSIFFADGEVVHAILGSEIGEEAVYELLTWEDADFELEMGVEPPERTITVNWSGLLLEGMRRIDESSADWDGLDEVDETDETDETEEEEMAKLNDILKDMSSEIPGFISSDVVGMDGLSVAHHSADPDFDAEAASAQFALVMKLVQKTTGQLGAGEVEDNLVTTEDAYILARFLGDDSYYLGVAVSKADASLGNLRLMTRQYADKLWDAIPK